MASYNLVRSLETKEVRNINMTANENRIVKALLNKAFEAGYVVSVNDGEEWVVKHSSNLKECLEAMASTDGDILKIRRKIDDTEHYELVATVWLVWGNDEDVISDHSDTEEANEFMKGIY